MPVLLTILDGWGIAETTYGNSIKEAGTPNFNRYWDNYPHTILEASGLAVGLPRGQMGNSEVGHLNMGAGRIVYQELTRITKEIEEGSFFQNRELLEAINHAQKTGGNLHLMGLLSDGGVHSHIEHLFALLELCRREKFSRVFIHAFLDGRDVPPQNAWEYIETLEARLKELGFGQIATVMGRYYAMDRDKRWERTEKAYRAMVFGEGFKVTEPEAAVALGYDRGETDEFVSPTVVLTPEGQPRGVVKEGDSIIFFNFRPDRARQITRAFVDDDFTGFNRKKIENLHFVCFTQYDKTIKAPVAFLPQTIENCLGEYLSKKQKKQLRIAETEKYAHVTFFFNGGVEKPYRGEERILIPSPKVATYDLKPEMSAYEVTEKLLEEMEKGYDLIVLNYANPDMVGHTGVFEAAVRAIKAVDECLGRVVDKFLSLGGTAIITADHGNAEKMLEEDGSPHTAHTTNPVPFILVGEKYRGIKLKEKGSLANVAPTILKILELEIPEEMTSEPLF
ncbi:2,3-bisphosphoglycerate-independent phosphoglycerate mutase [Carboxydothermus ferrireducens]|uniref:2,3-bisphosphoglycerate-independent phosphoglycerate mutase n=1 Tax=Carboxydothermus ferrireducens DSM 11255 TaxID=1119529 RepID=A0ABX2RBQ9_9THEO|nr:2,3-bisphosphoglycerate-independent phosphoglycerate mutase [Carboxydothermus ferrireducens]NYE57312.1 2,3-bisphosphoglycerate-independent phosphoglycerate mutase [Carboxydothermus ferrireducens DSM 11255]